MESTLRKSRIYIQMIRLMVGISSSPTRCYKVIGEDLNNCQKIKEWHFGYFQTKINQLLKVIHTIQHAMLLTFAVNRLIQVIKVDPSLIPS